MGHFQNLGGLRLVKVSPQGKGPRHLTCLIVLWEIFLYSFIWRLGGETQSQRFGSFSVSVCRHGEIPGGKCESEQ